MKKLLLSVPLGLCLLGCGSDYNAASNSANAASANAASANTANQATSNQAATTATATAMISPAATVSPDTTASPAATKTKVKAATKTYRVVDSPPGLPPQVVAVLKKYRLAPPPASMKVADRVRLKMTTSKGDITVELNGKAAPLHVKSFLYLSQKGFYNNTTFHRYVEGFVVQGGDPLSKEAAWRELAGSGGPGYEVPREYNALKHDAMVVAMARTSDPDSAGSQFYFTLAAAAFLDKKNSQDGFGYTVFGRVLKGQNVVLKLRQNDVLKSVSVVK